jgi:hypothetical protein
MAVTQLDISARFRQRDVRTDMKPAHLWDRDDPPGFPSLDGACLRRVLVQAQVRVTPMIVVYESSQMAEISRLH